MTSVDEQKLGALIMRARVDPAFKARLLGDGNAALAELGGQVAPGMTVKVVENTSTVMHLVLPAVPAVGEIPADVLDGVAGGVGPGGALTIQWVMDKAVIGSVTSPGIRLGENPATWSPSP